MKHLTDRIANLPARKRELLALRLRAQAKALAENGSTEPIAAVIGIGCRFPATSTVPTTSGSYCALVLMRCRRFLVTAGTSISTTTQLPRLREK